MPLWWKGLASADDIRRLVRGLEWWTGRPARGGVVGETISEADAPGGLKVRARGTFTARLRPRSDRPEMHWEVTARVRDGARCLRVVCVGADSRKAGAVAAIAALVLARKPYRIVKVK